MRVLTKKRYDAVFREEALALLQRSDRSIYAVAMDLGVPDATLRGWYNADVAKKQKKAHAKLPVGTPGAESIED